MKNLSHVTDVKFYEIAGLLCKICNFSDTTFDLPNFKPFEVTSIIYKHQLCFHVFNKVLGRSLKTSQLISNILRFSCSFGEIYCLKDSMGEVFYVESDNLIIGSFRLLNSRPTIIELWEPKYVNCLIDFVILFEYSGLCSKYSLIPIHASVVVYQNQALAFYGKSGQGKSTLANNCIKAIPCWILNDDNPIIKYEYGKWYVYGTPWSGKGKVYINKRMPLIGLFSVGKSKLNKLIKFGDQTIESFKTSFLPDFLSSCSYNPLNKASIFSLLESVYNIYNSINCYKYHCQNSGDAVLYLLGRMNDFHIQFTDVINICKLAKSMNFDIQFEVKGNSMFPTLRSGLDVVVITPDIPEISIGMIVLSTEYGGLLHRIIHIGKEKITLKGDGNNSVEKVSKGSIIGVVKKIYRKDEIQ